MSVPQQPNPPSTRFSSVPKFSDEAKAAAREVGIEIVKDIRRLATIHAKNDGLNTIDPKHIYLAHAQLTNKSRSWRRWAAQLCILIGGALLGIISTVLFDGIENTGITIEGGIALGIATVVLIVLGIAINER